jgi:hypothetical protein
VPIKALRVSITTTILSLKKFQDLQSGEFLDYLVLGNNILYSGRRLQHGVSWYMVVALCSLADGYNSVQSGRC